MSGIDWSKMITADMQRELDHRRELEQLEHQHRQLERAQRGVPVSPPLAFPLPFLCDRCHSACGVISEDLIEAYFEGEQIACLSCSEATTLRRAVSATMTAPMAVFFGTVAAEMLGASTRVATLTIRKHEFTEVDFAALGVPADSTLLKVNYTPNGPIMPLETHGNEPVWEPRSKVFLYGMPLGDEDQAECQFSLLISYIPHSPEEASVCSLAQAYQLFLAGRWGQMAISAITGLELTLKQYLRAFAAGRNLEPKDKEYLTQVYPQFCDLYGFARPEDDLVERVLRLWGSRDRFAHTGRLPEGYSRDSAAGQLCAAILLFRHLRRSMSRLQTPISSEQAAASRSS
ncbi:hypothetical protein [Stutzerimonas kunmingensis]|uniref:hypothetical protein n=1 Tax=Stutzerimonas kunmingensis TaxID=1211807 RepID=UPI002FCA50D1